MKLPFPSPTPLLKAWKGARRVPPRMNGGCKVSLCSAVVAGQMCVWHSRYLGPLLCHDHKVKFPVWKREFHQTGGFFSLPKFPSSFCHAWPVK